MRICNNINQEPYESLNAKNNLSILTKGMVRSVVVAVTVFQSVFMLKCIKMMFFYFFKIIFEISVSKRFKTYKKINFSKKNFEFFENAVPNVLLTKSKS